MPSRIPILKRSIRRAASLLRCGSASLLFILLLPSCQSDVPALPQEEDITPSTEIIAPTEEIQFEALWLEAETRSTVNCEWDGGEEITVMAGGNSKTYTVQTDGSLRANDGRLYWTRTDTMHISGYYSPVSPLASTFQIEARQDQTDTASGESRFERSDVLYAPTTAVPYAQTVQLAFCHLTAQVVITVTADASTGITDLSGATVQFVNQHTTSGQVKTDATVAPQTTAGTEAVTPEMTARTASLLSAKALLVPQQSAGIAFVTVSLNGEDYSYIPTTEVPVDLEAGNQYTFNLTLVKQSGNGDNGDGNEGGGDDGDDGGNSGGSGTDDTEIKGDIDESKTGLVLSDKCVGTWTVTVEHVTSTPK